MFAQLNAVFVTDYSTRSIRQFFLKDEILLNLHPLSYRRSLDLSTCGTVASKLYWLFVDGNRHGVVSMIIRLVFILSSVSVPLVHVGTFRQILLRFHHLSPC